MTSLVLSTAGSKAGSFVGSAIGSYFGGPAGGQIGGSIGSAVGSIAGSAAGRAIDNKLFGLGDVSLPTRHGGRLMDLAVQSSAYGEMIPIVYGNMRLAGNIIWSLPIKETAHKTTSTTGGGKGGGGKVTQSGVTYSYSVTLAIAICEGEIDGIVRVWADSKAINPSDGTYRIYLGSETQNPDTLIESYEGVGSTPAYRGLAYVVIEDFPLAEYGNRIPNFTFEVKRKVTSVDTGETSAEELVRSITIIPGAGEFVYDDTVQFKIPGLLVDSVWLQQGNKTRINQNNTSGKADGLVALDQLMETFPNLEYVSIVVGWFADSLDAGDAVIKPGVEYQSGAITSPDTWGVGSFTRSTARQITLVEGNPQYGGTPSDDSLLRFIQEIKSLGLNIMFYPIFFMDTADKPWRGRLTGSAADVASFFTKTNGYNAFINHYANLVKDDVDAFIIGSELVGLTSVQDVDDSFPAVDELVALAATVKTTVGDVLVSYAADWSEYHHDTNGWYNLDPLWSSANIDFIGIDAYFPITDEPEPVAGFDIAALRAGWTEGEGYDFYYSDEERTTQSPLSAAYAWKNIAWWWSNLHVNPDDATTSWTPESKPIWFTEYGYPSVDGASNQPNVFYDPNSSESAFPYHSRGKTDFRAQRNAITAAELEWAGSSMVERMFLWTWDARPFPFWPDLNNIWSDGGAWEKGHWVNGKLGASTLGAIVKDIAARVGIYDGLIDVSQLRTHVDGYVLSNQISARHAIDNLRSAFFFDAVESGGVVKFIPRGQLSAVTIDEDEIILGKNDNKLVDIIRLQELELPAKVDVVYLNKLADYQSGNQHSRRMVTNSEGVRTLNLPIVMTNSVAKSIADAMLYNTWLARTSYDFRLPVKYAYLEPCDVITITIGNATHVMRISGIDFGKPGIVRVHAVAEDISTYDFSSSGGSISGLTQTANEVGDTILHILDLPAFPSDDAELLRYASTGTEEAWHGAVIFRSDDGGSNYTEVLTVENAAVIGKTTDILASGTTDIFDEASTVTVALYGDLTLESVSELAVLNGANAALVGTEIIQFKNAELVEEGKYILSGFLRGRLGTENEISTHTSGEDFILLDSALIKEAAPNGSIGLSRQYKPVSIGNALADATMQEFTYAANSLKPYSPVHISGMRDGSDNLTISWVRRTRIGGTWRDYVDAPLAEESENYEVDIMDGSDVIRTITASSPTASYTAAEQTTDFGSPQSEVTVRVYQMSAIVGRGGKGEAMV